MPDTRDVPGWAERIAPTDTRRLVVCGCCGRSMSWDRFVHEHGPECEPAEEGSSCRS